MCAVCVTLDIFIYIDILIYFCGQYNANSVVIGIQKNSIYPYLNLKKLRFRSFTIQLSFYISIFVL